MAALLVALVPARAEGQLDLSLTTASGPAVATRGDRVSVVAVAASAAGTTVTARSSVKFYLSVDQVITTGDTLLGSVAANLAPGQSVTVTCSCVVPSGTAPGGYHIGAIVDPANSYAEASESNNAVAGGAISITSVSGDLTLTSIGGPISGSSGHLLGLTATAALSAGASRSLKPSIGFYLSADTTITASDRSLGAVEILLEPGETASVAPSLSVPGATPSGTYYIGAIVDYGGMYAETDEANNALVGNATAIAYQAPDLRPSSVTGPSFLVVGQAVDLSSSVISNPAGSISTRTYVGFYLSTDTEISATDVYLGHALVFLEPGWTETVSLATSIPSTTSVGLYHWGVIVLPSNYTESDGTNNALAGGTIVVGPGSCPSGASVMSNDGNPCTVEVCDVPGAVRMLVPAGTSCSDGEACNGAESCDANNECRLGTVPPIFDGNPCTIDTCDNGVGVIHSASPAGATCTDGNFCNGEELCDGLGACLAGVPPAIEDGDACTADACAPGPGLTHAPIYGCGPGACTPALGAFYRYDQVGNLTEVISTRSDPRHCGCIDTTCPDSLDGPTACGDGVCGVSYGGAFVNTSSDVNNCGRVANECGPLEHGTPDCRNGVCRAICLAGYVESGSGCIDPISDPRNCGWVGNVCPGADAGTAICEAGWCGSTGAPVVYSLNGMGSGEVFRSPMWQGITLTGAGLSAVTRIVFEDWGADTVDGTPTGERTIPSYLDGRDTSWDDRMLFPTNGTTLTIPELALLATAHLEGEWYRLRLFYGNVDPYTGLQPSVLVNFAVSLGWVESSVPPTVSAVSALQELTLSALYDSYTGFMAIENEWPSAPGEWSERGTAPTAILATDLLSTELPILSISPHGVYIRAGFPPPVVHRMVWEAGSAVFVFPYRNAPGDRVHLGDGNQCDGCPKWALRGGVLLRGSGLFGPAATLHLERPLGSPVPGVADTNAYGERSCFNEDCGYRYPFHGDRAIAWHFRNVEDSSARVIYASPYGQASTPWPLSFVNPPVLTGTSSAFVVYDQVMTLTARFLVDVTEVAFSGYGSEWLVPAPASPPGDGQYFVVDDKHLEVRLSSGSVAPPRGLAVLCSGGTATLESGAGERFLTVSNTDGTGSGGLLATDPQLPRPPVPMIYCPPPMSMSATEAGAGAPATSPTGTGHTLLIPTLPRSDCSNTICAP